MSINLGLPQIIYLTLTFIGLGITLSEHGTPKTGINNFWVTFIADAICIWLLVWGGFFKGWYYGIKRLVEFLDGDIYLQLIDVESDQHIEADANNTLIQYFEELEIEDIYTSGTLYIKVRRGKQWAYI